MGTLNWPGLVLGDLHNRGHISLTIIMRKTPIGGTHQLRSAAARTEEGGAQI